jgi:uncharacterized OsmC-like protein/esterase/lipase
MKFNFPNTNGEILAGKLELPVGTPKAFALFAHCFTCSKDFVASSVISKSLADRGIAVLRFDFTGLGNSQGDFANSNFSSNVEDLIAAYAQLSKEYEPPQILIGHSLGGAAVLKAATQLDAVKAVVTIGAPSCTGHVSHLFAGHIDEINQDGQTDVELGGRKFTVKKQFIDDINEVDILDGIKNFKKALLIMHSPLDVTVSVNHAATIFQAAKHPKSFASLDDADHLLVKKQDADYAAGLIATWVERYLLTTMENTQTQPEVDQGHIVVKARNEATFTQDIYSSNHHLVADEPASVKGNDLGMTPYDLLLAGLGACTSMTVKMYAARKKIMLDDVRVELTHEKIHAMDCESCEDTKGKIDVIHKRLSLTGEFTPEQEERMHEIAEKCPVNLTLQSNIKIVSQS